MVCLLPHAVPTLLVSLPSYTILCRHSYRDRGKLLDGCLRNTQLGQHPVLTEILLGTLFRNAVGTAVLLLGSCDTGVLVLKLCGTRNAAWLIDCLLSMHETRVLISSTA